MKMSRNPVRFAAGLAVAIAAVSTLFVQNLRVAVADTAAATETPKALFNEKCSACHNAPDPNAEAMTASEWQDTVNRMLYKHGAKDDISPDQAQTIVTYLDTFAVTAASLNQSQGPRFGHGNVDSSDVWSTNPVYSHVYQFRTTQIAAPFRSIDGRWSVRDAGNGPLLVVAAFNAARPAILVAPTPGPHGDLQIEADFRTAPPPPDTPAAATASIPLSFGLTFDTTDSGDYDLASYDDSKRQLTLTEFRNGKPNILQIIPLESGLTATADGWHKMRVNVLENRAKVWLDYEKRIDSTLSDTPGNGGAGLWTGTRAAAKSFVLDIYPTVVPNVVGVG
jgi:hypothetical protein